VNFLLLLAGMGLGWYLRSWSNRAGAVIAVSVLAALLWGALMADHIVAGTMWALLNLAVGVGIIVLVRWTLDRAGDGPIGG
jgi:hypothetical protein